MGTTSTVGTTNLISLNAAAKATGLSTRVLERLIASGKLACWHPGGRFLVREADVLPALESSRVQPGTIIGDTARKGEKKRKSKATE